MTNLLLTLLDKVGVHADTLGDSTGRIDTVSGLCRCSYEIDRCTTDRATVSSVPRSSMMRWSTLALLLIVV